MITKSMIISKLPLTIEWMIENALLQTILNFIKANKTMLNSSKWQLIWPFMWIVKNKKIGHSTQKKGG
jgi:hypothetical protein